MKARKIKGLDAEGTLLENACRTARVRVDELYGFMPAALDPGEIEALHDMRIAAKRVRYVFEVTEPALGRLARDGAKQAKKLQDLLGEIHDCDEMAPLVRAHIERLRGEDVAAALARGDEDEDDLEAAAAGRVPNRARYRGLETLVTYLEARRRFLHRRFLEQWQALEEDGFRQRIEGGLAALESRDGDRVS